MLSDNMLSDVGVIQAIISDHFAVFSSMSMQGTEKNGIFWNNKRERLWIEFECFIQGIIFIQLECFKI